MRHGSRLLLTVLILTSCTRAATTTSASPSGPSSPIVGTGRVADVRMTAHEGYDRVEFEFDGTVPGYEVSPHGLTFGLSPSEGTVTLQGTGGLLVKIQPQDWLSYRGPDRSEAALPFLREARMVENFEGAMQWGLGVAGTPCVRVTTLADPPAW